MVQRDRRNTQIIVRWHIHTSGQYPNCECIKALIIALCCSICINLETLAKAWSFWLAFLQRFDTCFSNFILLSIVTPNNFWYSLLLISFSAILKITIFSIFGILLWTVKTWDCSVELPRHLHHKWSFDSLSILV